MSSLQSKGKGDNRMSILKSEVEALELLTKAGRVDPNVAWSQAISEAGNIIIALAGKIKVERSVDRKADDMSMNELEALELLVKAGRVAPNVEWFTIMGEAGNAIVALADRIVADRESMLGAVIADMSK
jgi:hypothetical protein